MSRIHPNQPLENHMVIGDYYAGCTSKPDTCAKCGDEEYDMLDTHLGLLCSSCTRECVLCEDWLLTDPTVTDSLGNEVHKECAEAFERGEYDPI